MNRSGVTKAVRMTDAGWEWMDRNEDKFLIRRERKKKSKDESDWLDDEIPF